VVYLAAAAWCYYPNNRYIHATAFVAHQFFEVYVIVDQ